MYDDYSGHLQMINHTMHERKIYTQKLTNTRKPNVSDCLTHTKYMLTTIGLVLNSSTCLNIQI